MSPYLLSFILLFVERKGSIFESNAHILMVHLLLWLKIYILNNYSKIHTRIRVYKIFS